MSADFDIDAELSEINSPIYERTEHESKEGIEDLIWLTSKKIDGVAIIPFIPEGKYVRFFSVDRSSSFVNFQIFTF